MFSWKICALIILIIILFILYKFIFSCNSEEKIYPKINLISELKIKYMIIFFIFLNK